MKVSRFERATDVVWRTAPDRILLRRVGDQCDTGSVEVFGPAALVWLALDEPATTADLEDRLAEAGVAADLASGLSVLVERHLVVETVGR